MTPLQMHLEAVGACAPARKWVGTRTAQQVWDECDRPGWLIWWVVRTHPEWRYRVALLLVRELRAHTLECTGRFRPLAAASLDATEAWAVNPSGRTRQAANKASWFARAACFDHTDSAAMATRAIIYANGGDAPVDIVRTVEANYTSCALLYGIRTPRRLSWLAAIRSEFKCPWTEEKLTEGATGESH